MALDLEGVCASSGSACMVGSVVASHVLLAMGRRRSGRFRDPLLVRQTNDQLSEIEQTIEAIERILRRLNSPASADKAQNALV